MIGRLCCLILLLAGNPASGATLSDDLGNVLPLSPSATRVVTLSPHTTEILLMTGGAPLLVGAASHAQALPAHTLRLNTLGGIDRELLLQLAPDLVVAWASGNRAGDIAWLQAQGIRVFLSEPQDMQQLAANIRSIGRLIGRAKPAAAAAAGFLQRLHGACASRGEREVYVAIWDRPAMSVGGRHWLNDALGLAGLRNTYAGVERGVFAVERESLVAKQQLLNVSPGTAGSGTGKAIAIDELSRPGPSLAQGLERLCHRLGMPGPDR